MAENRMRQFGQSIQNVGRSMATFGVMSAIPIGMAVQRFAQFDDQMRTVRAVSQATEAEFQQLTATAQRLASAGSFTAVQIAGLMTELGRAGFTATQVEQMTEAVLNLARATGTDATLSAGIMAASLRQFNLGANQATRVVDALTVAANASFTSVEQLGEALSYAGPVAQQFGLSLEDTLAVLGTLGNVGIQGSNAGTALRRILTLTGAEAQRLQQIFGVSALDAAGNLRPIVDVLDEVGRSMQGLGSGAQAQRMNEFFGLLGITGATAIGQNISMTRDLQRQLQSAGGTAARTAQEMDAGLGGGIRRTVSAVEGFAITLGDALAPVLQLIGTHLTNSLGVFRDWISENRAAALIVAASVVGVVALGAALIGIGITLKLIAFAIGAVTALFSVFGFVAGAAIALVKFSAIAMWAAITAPIGILLVSLDALRTYFLMNAVAGTQMGSTLGGMFRDLGGVATSTWEGVRDAIQGGDLESAVQIAGLGMRAAWASIIANLQTMWRGFRDFFIDTWEEMQNQMALAIVGQQGGFLQGVADVLLGPTPALIAQTPEGQQIGAALNADAEEARRRRERERALANAQSVAEAAAIRAELEAARQAASDRRRFGTMDDWLDFLGEDERASRMPDPSSIRSGMAGAMGRAEAAGTFSAFAVSGLGASSVTDRIARATEETAHNTRNNAQPAFT